ncbi:MAG: hypothetical protein HYW51_00155 [Candidatus Doudnabacteria bacterium]|nr:hypothetical protein [Candidatus Doudnabacteria bacterium]
MPDTTPGGGQTLATKIAVAAGAVLVIGPTINALLGTSAGGAITSGLLILVLSAVLIDHLRPAATIDDRMVRIAGMVILGMVLLGVGFRIIPSLQQDLKELLYGLLPPHTEQAARRRAEDLDVRIASGLDPLGTRMREFLILYRRQMGSKAEAELRTKLSAVYQKVGTDNCWGWDEAKRVSTGPFRCTATLV